MSDSVINDIVEFETRVMSGDLAYAFGPRTSEDGEQHPLVVVVHGSHVHPKQYSEYSRALAREGFVVIVPEHVREFMGDTAHYPQQAVINWGVTWAEEENARADSPLHGRIDTDHVFLSGHSMGGGTTLGIVSDFSQFGLVVDEWSRPPSLVAAVVNGTHNIPPPRTGDPLPIDNKVPLAFVQGSIDSVVATEKVLRTFDVVQGVKPHLYVELDGGTHFFITDEDNPEGVNPDKNTPTLGQDVGIQSAARWTARWFRANLGDTQALADLRGGPGEDEPFVTIRLVEADQG
jgi:dienelactone hydrolase